ncbi:molecular chaperone SurA [Candidatus Blochmannia ocreatus (nom. nud.)]|uniref:Molecular chaperone SurA n=1 Tax=Candidatus Blochmannia ocreatus (nom. nud.) TaxID=251538 RepID=A0ABY4STK0_9ENTR|nr:molecular chaperone SurA [Candidatus Blochmannia ocreatus]URJ25211.1 molecular chaperone SurA [Candidatus Blochmannia ocreatus]
MEFWKKLTLVFIFKTSVVLGEFKTIDKIVALVNNNAILDSDVKHQIYMTRNNIFDINLIDITPDILSYKRILEQLIIENIIFQITDHTNFTVEYNQIHWVIERIAMSYGMTIHQFQEYLNDINIDYQKYYFKQYQDILKRTIYSSVLHQYGSNNISINEINNIINKFNVINFNKQFKLNHIVFSLPINPTLNQINKTKYFAKLLIDQKKYKKFDKKDLINIYYYNDIIHTIRIIDSEWTNWQDIPVIFDEYLSKIEPGNIIGPIASHDGIHILEIKDIRYKKASFPITKVYAKIFGIKESYDHVNITKELTKIKELVENTNTPFSMIINEKLKNHSCFNFYIENITSKDLDMFDSEIQQMLLSLKKNEVSTPIYTNYGGFLIQLIDMSVINYSDIKYERAYLYLLDKKNNEIMNKWIQELHSSSYIKIIHQNEKY